MLAFARTEDCVGRQSTTHQLFNHGTLATCIASFHIMPLSVQTLSVQTLSVDQLESQDPRTSERVLSAIEAAFGPDGPGILLVNGLHSHYISDRASFLSAGRALAALPPHELKKLEFGADIFLGWSRGREMFKGTVDNQKASFYANPIYDHPAGGSNHLVAKYPYVSLSNHGMSLMRSLL